MGRATAQQLTKYPIFPIIKSAGPTIFALDVAALAANPSWFVWTYNGPLSPGDCGDRAAVMDPPRLEDGDGASGYQLDEFPYASTAQGGLGPPPAWGAPVPALENLVQGGLLSAFYRYSLKGAPNTPFLVVPVPL